MRMISRAWISMSVAWPPPWPQGWCSRTREWVSARRLPGVPAASSTAAADAACPKQIVLISFLMNDSVS